MLRRDSSWRLICWLLGAGISLSACSNVSATSTAIKPEEEVAPTQMSEAAPPTATPLVVQPPEVTSSSSNSDLNFAQVVFVRATQGSDGRWTFDVSVRHNDEGWEHYADAWQVVTSSGQVLAERVLTHPHDTEQPFTRSQSNISIPAAITKVTVRAKCNLHGFGGHEVVVDLTTTRGKDFEVTRL